MDAARIAALLDPFLSAPLRSAQLAQIATYIDLLLRWNARTNLTAIREPDEIVTRHFGESLFAAQTLFPASQEVPAGNPPAALDLIDLGSGAGFPGIPMQIWAPSLRTTLIESQQKKVAFLREVIRTLTLTSINVFPARAEDFLIREGPAKPEAARPLRPVKGRPHTETSPPPLFATKDGAPFKPSFGLSGEVPHLEISQPPQARVVTLRAVERFDQILPIAANLVAPAGRLALLIATPQAAAAQSALPEFQWQPALALPKSSDRILLIAHAPNQDR
jgi:16S rRNA (guanine(527)-N(7))-methyltransferase RsmG